MKQLIVTKLSPNKMITSNGYLVCSNAILARTGKQQYLKSEIYEDSDDDEIIEVDRKPEQVFADATIASFENVPLTCEHPYENVTPENYKEYSVGYVRDVHKGKFNNQNVLMGTLVVTDPQCIQDIRFAFISAVGQVDTAWNYLDHWYIAIIPLVITISILTIGALVFRRKSKFFAEEV